MKAVIYPPADTSTQWFANKYPGSIMALTEPVFCGHTTEGGYGWPGYQLGAVAPTLTGLPILAEKRVAWRQHFPINMSARALANKAGGVQTNTAGVIQIELCGTCVVGGPGMYWPDAPDWAIEEVAKLGRWLVAEWGVPNILPPRGFRRFENLRGDVQRMTFGEWTSFTGICEHQNVPENDHGDGGGVMERVAAATFNTPPPPPPPPGDDMPTPADLWNYRIVVGKDSNGGDVSGTAAQLMAQMNQQDWYQTNTIKALADALSKATSDPNVTAANVEKWIKEGLASAASARFEGTLTVTPAGAAVATPATAAPAPADAPDLDKTAPSPQEDTPGHDGPVAP